MLEALKESVIFSKIKNEEIKEIVYLSDKYDGTDTNRASKKMLDSAGVKYRKFTPNMDKLEIDFKNI